MVSPSPYAKTLSELDMHWLTRFKNIQLQTVNYTFFEKISLSKKCLYNILSKRIDHPV